MPPPKRLVSTPSPSPFPTSKFSKTYVNIYEEYTKILYTKDFILFCLWLKYLQRYQINALLELRFYDHQET